MKPIIKVENLSKQYRIGARQAPYKTIRETVTEVFTAPFNAARRKRNNNGNTIWALKDVGFEVMPGEVVGVIGRNGAGKSTLLKVLSRITEPTAGQVDLYGRVGSLLEVGTGFHPELTGRENIYLNGAILGMQQREIERKFDEIVAFAEIEKFLDTPVKHYSSGMYMRLAFSVAAHLEPEILLVDEVLAVGDAAFQKKCLGKMGDVARQGRTVLFVSHNMSAVSILCPKTILLQSGRIVACETTPNVISQYLSFETQQSAEALWSFEEASGSQKTRLRAVRVLNRKGQVSFDVDIDEPITLEMEFWITQKSRMTPSFHVYNQQGLLLFAVANLHDDVWGALEYTPGIYQCRCVIPGNYLNNGQHYLTLYLTSDNNSYSVEVVKNEVVSFRVHDNGASRGDYMREWSGLVRPILAWTGSQIGEIP